MVILLPNVTPINIHLVVAMSLHHSLFTSFSASRISLQSVYTIFSTNQNTKIHQIHIIGIIKLKISCSEQHLHLILRRMDLFLCMKYIKRLR